MRNRALRAGLLLLTLAVVGGVSVFLSDRSKRDLAEGPRALPSHSSASSPASQPSAAVEPTKGAPAESSDRRPSPSAPADARPLEPQARGLTSSTPDNDPGVERALAIYSAEVKACPNPPTVADLIRLREAEAKLIASLRDLDAESVPAIELALLRETDSALRLSLAKGLAGRQAPEALAAVQRLLGATDDLALHAALLASLPRTLEVPLALRRSLRSEERPRTRVLLLRECWRRTGPPGSAADTHGLVVASSRDEAAEVRSEAISILARGARPEDQPLLLQIARTDDNAQIRQRALIAYSRLAGGESLEVLEAALTSAGTSPADRSAVVVAIARVGGERALTLLRRVEAEDRSDHVRARARALRRALETHPTPAAD